MTRKTAYWLCQIGGWGVYSILGFCFTTWAVGVRMDVAIGYALFFVYSIAFTDWLRREMIRRHWLDDLSFGRVAKLFGMGSLLAVLQTSLIAGISFLFLGRHTEYVTEPIVMLETWWGITWVNGTWIGLYSAITRRRRQREKDARMESALRDAELRALEAQINPHFLFNSLNSIRGLVTENPALAQEMITRFATLLRYNLNRDVGHTVPLSAEAEVVADYLALEQIRLDERLRVQFYIDPKANSVQVPPMLLQTLVENALKHGIGRLPEGGEIRIRAAAEPQTLVLKVENSGQLTGGKIGDSQIGLSNIRERLRLLYGERAGIQLANGDANHVAATVRIPAPALA
ncbi:MAG: histidine kinase [Bryobacterales bacterium]|nr:histidine kinase [Bryobacterales bacterium]MBV9398381.1 histidine kinase [Bryobacterales bacterium]